MPFVLESTALGFAHFLDGYTAAPSLPSPIGSILAVSLDAAVSATSLGFGAVVGAGSGPELREVE